MSSKLYKINVITEDKDFKIIIAQHPSESIERVILRALLYIYFHNETPKFTSEVCQGDMPDIETKSCLIFVDKKPKKAKFVASKFGKKLILATTKDHQIPINPIDQKAWYAKIDGQNIIINDHIINLNLR